MIEYYRRTRAAKKLTKLEKFLPNSLINVINPTDDELKSLIQDLDLDEHNVLSGIDDNEIPRIDFEDNETYIFLKTVRQLKLVTFLIILGKNYVLTLCKSNIDFLDKIIDNKIRFITSRKLKCLITILAMNNRLFEAVTVNAIKAVDRQKKLDVELNEKDVANLIEKEDLLNSLVSTNVNTGLVYSKLAKRINFSEDDIDILEDLIIESEEDLSLCRANLKTISNVREYYLILTSNKLNRIITLLTIFTIFISIPAAISGFYGMNILLPIQNNPNAFYYISGLIIFMWAMFILYLKRIKVL